MAETEQRVDSQFPIAIRWKIKKIRRKKFGQKKKKKIKRTVNSAERDLNFKLIVRLSLRLSYTTHRRTSRKIFCPTTDDDEMANFSYFFSLSLFVSRSVPPMLCRWANISFMHSVYGYYANWNIWADGIKQTEEGKHVEEQKWKKIFAQTIYGITGGGFVCCCRCRFACQMLLPCDTHIQQWTECTPPTNSSRLHVLCGRSRNFHFTIHMNTVCSCTHTKCVASEWRPANIRNRRLFVRTPMRAMQTEWNGNEQNTSNPKWEVRAWVGRAVGAIYVE